MGKIAKYLSVGMLGLGLISGLAGFVSYKYVTNANCENIPKKELVCGIKRDVYKAKLKNNWGSIMQLIEKKELLKAIEGCNKGIETLKEYNKGKELIIKNERTLGNNFMSYYFDFLSGKPYLLYSYILMNFDELDKSNKLDEEIRELENLTDEYTKNVGEIYGGRIRYGLSKEQEKFYYEAPFNLFFLKFKKCIEKDLVKLDDYNDGWLSDNDFIVLNEELNNLELKILGLEADATGRIEFLERHTDPKVLTEMINDKNINIGYFLDVIGKQRTNIEIILESQ